MCACEGGPLATGSSRGPTEGGQLRAEAAGGERERPGGERRESPKMGGAAVVCMDFIIIPSLPHTHYCCTCVLSSITPHVYDCCTSATLTYKTAVRVCFHQSPLAYKTAVLVCLVQVHIGRAATALRRTYGFLLQAHVEGITPLRRAFARVADHRTAGLCNPEAFHVLK